LTIPIDVKLRAIKQKRKGRRNASGFAHETSDHLTPRSQFIGIKPTSTERANFFANGLTHLNQTAINPGPPRGESNPMVKKQPKEFGRELRFHAFGFETARFVQFANAFASKWPLAPWSLVQEEGL
jgi:hypothetical protein